MSYPSQYETPPSTSSTTRSSEVVREALRLMEKIERQEAKKFRFLDSGDVGAPHIPLADIANWGVPQPVAEGG